MTLNKFYLEDCCNLTKGYWIRNNQNRGVGNEMEIFKALTKYNTR